MFEAFSESPARALARRRLATSTGAAVLVYAGIGAAVALLAAAAPKIVEEKLLDVTFEKPAQKPATPAPPAPKPQRVTPPVAQAVATPPPPTLVPKEVPVAPPPEAEPTGQGTSASDAPGDEAPSVARYSEPVNLPEAAIPPVPSEANTAPAYPEAARATGKEGQVILKVVVADTGRVTHIEVLRGDPPFVEAALTAVRSWTFAPATLDGHPIAVYRIIKIPFRLSVGG